ncbi:MAG: RNA ligase RtcB family protein [Pseudomonadota bacterium]
MIERIQKNSVVKIMASSEALLEGDAIMQLDKTASLEGMQIVVGLPDLHPGKGVPVGAAFLCGDRIYPHIVGNDVGCGIGLWKTTLRSNKNMRDAWAKKLKGLHLPWDGDLLGWMRDFGVDPSGSNARLGTIGSGNHFAELQMVEEVRCEERFHVLGLDRKELLLLVHSGSRGIGELLLRQHTNRLGASPIPEDSDWFLPYLQSHDFAIEWARCNRALIAKRFCQQLNADYDAVSDSCHNSIEKIDTAGRTGWLHRKGAAPADKGVVVIPGSRGALSYLIEPVGEQQRNLWSLAHGAGRKWNRKSCRERLKNRFETTSLSQTEMGSVVICDDKELLFEEAPQAYKNIENIIRAMQREGLIRVIASFRPLITYKVRSEK